MKKLLLLTGLALSFCFVAKATNYFTAGTEWIEEFNYMDQESLEFIDEMQYFKLEASADSDAPGLAMYKSLSRDFEDAKLIAWVKTEDSKVWFMKPNLPDWYLMYDFGLQPGEKGIFYDIDNYDYAGLPSGRELRCLEVIENNPEFCGFDTLLMTAWEDDEDDPERLDAGYWIAGIGTEDGLDEFASFGIVGDAESRLLAVKHDGEVVYENYPAGIESIKTDSSKQTSNPSASVYDLTGRMVGKRADLSTLPSGIYISNGRKIMK